MFFIVAGAKNGLEKREIEIMTNWDLNIYNVYTAFNPDRFTNIAYRCSHPRSVIFHRNYSSDCAKMSNSIEFLYNHHQRVD